MTTKANRQREALRRARQRDRARDAAEFPAPAKAACDRELADAATPDVRRRRLAATTCGWCAGPIEAKSRGRIPKWCSAACRQRAWEQNRAASSGRAAVQIVERRIEVPVPAAARHGNPTHGEWLPLLAELARQLDTGAVYPRDLNELMPAIENVLHSLRTATGGHS
ncbi:MAG: hypothetical protein ACR2LX_01630 [Jatrophihabitans sp.]